jgi:hypothetical protein
MEDILDSIANGNTIWHELCRECFGQIELLTSQIDLTDKISTTKESIMSENNNTENNKNNENNENNSKKEKALNKKLGKYNGDSLVLKKGKFGLYVTWGDNKKSLTGLDKEADEITLDDVITHINKPITNAYQINQGQGSQDNPNFVRYINNDLSIRKGKFGDYIYYKTKTMKTPKFFNLSKYKGSYKTDDLKNIIQWIRETYSV